MGRAVRRAGRVAVALLLALSVVVVGDAASWADERGAIMPPRSGSYITQVSGWEVICPTASGLSTTVGCDGPSTYDNLILIKFPSGQWTGTHNVTLYCAESDGSGEVVATNGTWAQGTTTYNPAATPVGSAAATCSGGKTFSKLTVIKASGSVTLIDYRFTAAVSDPSTCDAFLVDAQASYVGGTLSVRTKVTRVWGSGWRVYELASPLGVPGDEIGTFSAPEIEGYFGWYGDDWVTGDPGGYVRIEKGNNDECWQAVEVATTPVDIDPPETGTDSENEGASCGLNPFCYVKSALQWAFVPNSATFVDMANTFGEFENRWPLGLLADGQDLVVTVFQAEPACASSTNGCWPDDLEVFEETIIPYDSWAGEWFRDHRALLELVLWLTLLIPLTIKVFWNVVPVVGGGGRGGGD